VDIASYLDISDWHLKRLWVLGRLGIHLKRLWVLGRLGIRNLRLRSGDRGDNISRVHRLCDGNISTGGICSRGICNRDTDILSWSLVGQRSAIDLKGHLIHGATMAACVEHEIIASGARDTEAGSQLGSIATSDDVVKHGTHHRRKPHPHIEKVRHFVGKGLSLGRNVSVLYHYELRGTVLPVIV